MSTIVDLLATGNVEVGWFPEDRYMSGKSIGGVAGVHEFGSVKRGIPARSFMRPTANANYIAWRDTFADLLRRGKTTKQALELVGEEMRGDIIERILRMKSPKLLPATIARKREEYPTNATNLLRASGMLVRTIKAKVKCR